MSSKCFLEIPLRVKRRVVWLKVDAADWAELANSRWYVIAGGYVARTKELPRCECCNRARLTFEYLHRVLLLPGAGLEVDHLNGEKLDNRRCNLRVVSAGHNMQNRRGWSKRSVFKGVYQVGAQYRATIMVTGTKHSLGTFATAEEAARAYDAAARTHYGEHAKTNFPQ